MLLDTQKGLKLSFKSSNCCLCFLWKVFFILSVCFFDYVADQNEQKTEIYEGNNPKHGAEVVNEVVGFVAHVLKCGAVGRVFLRHRENNVSWNFGSDNIEASNRKKNSVEHHDVHRKFYVSKWVINYHLKSIDKSPQEIQTHSKSKVDNDGHNTKLFHNFLNIFDCSLVIFAKNWLNLLRKLLKSRIILRNKQEFSFQFSPLLLFRIWKNFWM